MKKAIAVILPLVLLASAVSCSKNSSSSETPSAASSAVSDVQNVGGYTKSVLQDNVLVNECANIRMNIPDDLRLASDKELSDLVASSASYYNDEKNIAFESGIIWDSWITNNGNLENVFLRFIDTKTAFPNSSDAAAEDVLDVYRERNDGSGAKYEDRAKVSLGGAEYVREVFSFEASDFDPAHYNYMYARKLDDGLVCLISISTINGQNTPEYFEKLFN